MRVGRTKPRASVSEMEVIPHTVRNKTHGYMEGVTIKHIKYTTATYRYPDGHPMREYKDRKKALKQ